MIAGLGLLGYITTDKICVQLNVVVPRPRAQNNAPRPQSAPTGPAPGPWEGRERAQAAVDPVGPGEIGPAKARRGLRAPPPFRRPAGCFSALRLAPSTIDASSSHPRPRRLGMESRGVLHGDALGWIGRKGRSLRDWG